MKKLSREFEFRAYAAPWDLPDSAKNCACLVADNWDDFGFRTLFKLIVFDEAGKRLEVGYVKIGKFGMEQGLPRTLLPPVFEGLDDEFFSLGQDDGYYEALGELSGSLKDRILTGLRDVVANEGIWESARQQVVMSTSLLRSVTQRSVEGQYRRIVMGGARLTDYDFTYTIPKRMVGSDDSLRLAFVVKPESLPPTNIHVLIGRNGVGKTHILQLMAKALVAGKSAASQSGSFSSSMELHSDSSSLFANLVSVSFSAFDDFELLPERAGSEESLRYSYIGLRRSSASSKQSGVPKSTDMLTGEFVKSAQVCMNGVRVDRWRRVLAVLESDPIFRAAGVTELTDAGAGSAGVSEDAAKLFKSLSSGHKIVLLTITRLVETVEEQTLVLLDEPESYLHPPLLSAFVRGLSDLLVDRNGVAIVATHSPVVLQEVPRSCAWVLYRSGRNVTAARPELETFGENVGILTREVFGYEVTDSGFHSLLRKAALNAQIFEQALGRFNGELGAEARAILRSLLLEASHED